MSALLQGTTSSYEFTAIEDSLVLGYERADHNVQKCCLSSVARWTDGRLHPMNLPGLERERFSSP